MSRRNTQQRKRDRMNGSNGLGFEALEAKRLLAVTYSYDAGADKLTIFGDAANDQVNVRSSNGSVWVYAQDTAGTVNQYWNPSVPVSFVEFWGNDGSDKFTNFTTVPSSMFGGSGNDFLRGGDANDFGYGGSGRDFLWGGNGNDYLIGETGDDWIEGEAGNDTLGGNAGNDVTLGGPGNDQMWGDAGADWLDGGDGNDVILGGSGNDIISGGAGDEWIEGRDGDDFIAAGPGADIIGGNGGLDAIVGGPGNDQIWGDGDDNDRVEFAGNIANYSSVAQGNSFVVTDATGNEGVDTITTTEFFRFADLDRAAGEFDSTSNAVERITVQAIVVSNDNGSNTSLSFGSSAKELEIKQTINDIYAQAQVEVVWLATNFWNNTWANFGNAGSSERPSEDLNQIASMGDAAGVGSSNPLVLDMYFVQVSPCHIPKGPNNVSGCGNRPGNNSVMYVGANRVDLGDDGPAEVIAHEFGHNLGLPHVSIVGNLMESGGDGVDLTSSQISTIIDSQYTVPI